MLGTIAITNCRECPTNMVAHHWMTAPWLFHVCYSLLTFLDLSNTFLHVPVAGWLNLITHLLLYPSYNAPIQSVMSNNMCALAGYLAHCLTLQTETLL